MSDLHFICMSLRISCGFSHYIVSLVAVEWRQGKVFRRTVGHKKPPLIHGWALIQCKLNCKNSFCGFFFLHTAQTWSRKKKEITTLRRGSIVLTRVKMSGGRVGDKKLPMLLHLSSSCCSSYANLAGTRDAKNLE